MQRVYIYQEQRYYIILVLASLRWLPVSCGTDHKILLLVYKSIILSFFFFLIWFLFCSPLVSLYDLSISS